MKGEREGLVGRLREHATDWDGSQMPDLEPAKGDPTAGTLRDAAAMLEADAARIKELEAGLRQIARSTNVAADFKAIAKEIARALLKETTDE